MKASRKYLAVFLVFVVLTVGCVSVDQVLAGLQVADNVAKAAQPILVQANPEVATVLGKVSADLELIIKTYNDYEAAAPGDKPSKALLIQATASAVQANLSEILSAVGVKNPELLQYISVAVAVVNSAIMIVVAKLPASASGTVARSAEVQKLPLIDKATSAKDLKNAWNQAVSKAYPASKI